MRDNRISDREGFTFYFQLADGIGRRACAVTITSPTKDRAEDIFRKNSEVIVQMARDNIALGLGAGASLSLSFP